MGPEFDAALADVQIFVSDVFAPVAAFVNENPPTAIGATVLVVSVLLAGAIGFWSARRMYRRRLDQRMARVGDEMARLRRQVASLEARASRAKLDADRQKRRGQTVRG